MSALVVRCGTDYDLRETFGILRFGRDDPTIRLDDDEVWRATRTPVGAATVHYAKVGGELHVDAWGEGADAALAAAAEVAGLADDVAAFTPEPATVPADLRDRHPGLRLVRTGNLSEALLLAITAQAASGFEAHRAHRQLLRALGSDAPGPGGLRLSPTANAIAGVAAYDLHTIGFEPGQADHLRRAAAQAQRLDGIDDPVQARAALRSVSGLEPGSIEFVLLTALGDPDAVPVGNPNRARLVGEVLSGEPHADDDRMVELLEPWRGQRGRVVRLIEADRALDDERLPYATISPSSPPRSG